MHERYYENIFFKCTKVVKINNADSFLVQKCAIPTLYGQMAKFIPYMSTMLQGSLDHSDATARSEPFLELAHLKVIFRTSRGLPQLSKWLEACPHFISKFYNTAHQEFYFVYKLWV